jgi:hypothetical protein
MSKMQELLNPFASVKNLCLCEKIMPRIEEQITVTSENHRYAHVHGKRFVKRVSHIHDQDIKQRGQLALI